MAVWYDPRPPNIHADPYSHYHQLRSEDPVHWSDLIQAWVLSRYDDIVRVLRDPRFSNAARLQVALRVLPESAREELAAISQVMTRVLAYLDPPAHTRLRRYVNRVFQPRVIDGLRPRIQNYVDMLLDTVQDKGRMDVIFDFAYPLTVLVSVAMLGLPFQDLARLAQWSDDFSALSGPELVIPQTQQRAERAIIELVEYFRGILAERRASPGEDIISILISAEEQPDRVSDDELISICLMTLLGGHRNLRNIIGVAVLTLLCNPDQLKKLQAEPSFLPIAVEELLRYDFIEQGLTRVAVADVEISGKIIHTGQCVLLLLGAANRDPAQFVEPDQLNVGRRENHHLAFGVGSHSCPGASISRVVLEITLATMLRRLPNLSLTMVDAQREARLGGRGLISLPVTFSRR